MYGKITLALGLVLALGALPLIAAPTVIHLPVVVVYSQSAINYWGGNEETLQADLRGQLQDCNTAYGKSGVLIRWDLAYIGRDPTGSLKDKGESLFEGARELATSRKFVAWLNKLRPVAVYSVFDAQAGPVNGTASPVMRPGDLQPENGYANAKPGGRSLSLMCHELSHLGGTGHQENPGSHWSFSQAYEDDHGNCDLTGNDCWALPIVSGPAAGWGDKTHNNVRVLNLNRFALLAYTTRPRRVVAANGFLVPVN